MTVLTTSVVTLKPGRFEDYREMASKGKAIAETCGGKNIRLFGGFFAGEATGQLVFTMEADDFAAAGAATDKALANPEIQAMLASSETGPIAKQQTSQWIEIPL